MKMKAQPPINVLQYDCLLILKKTIYPKISILAIPQIIYYREPANTETIDQLIFIFAIKLDFYQNLLQTVNYCTETEYLRVSNLTQYENKLFYSLYLKETIIKSQKSNSIMYLFQIFLLCMCQSQNWSFNELICIDDYQKLQTQVLVLYIFVRKYSGINQHIQRMSYSTKDGLGQSQTVIVLLFQL
ncbi:unnamed protein product [Paramecium sonneborni]|uniref:Uncharacterized protein n=1 Tax=Paramecium sonneborni TaxID=65129 RepID=A0A8S1M1M6_9CILI|nr:unnamed protein product [Paramecium sonneborni]